MGEGGRREYGVRTTSVSARGVARKMGTGGRRDAVDSLNDVLDCWVMRNAGRWGCGVGGPE
jgi:hypothetical protein